MAFSYNINVTGDCSGSSNGVIDLIISDGSQPFTIQWITPALATDIVLTSVTKTNLVSATYSIIVTDSSLPANQVEYLNIPVSNGVCCSFDTLLNPCICAPNSSGDI